MFEIHSNYEPRGDQPQAIAALSEGLAQGLRHQVLLGVTGSGKTFTMANIIKNLNRPALVIAHNKTLAAQQYLMLEALFHALCQRSNGLRLIAGGLILGMNLKGGHSSPPPFPYGCKYYTTNYKGGSVQTPPPRKLN